MLKSSRNSSTKKKKTEFNAGKKCHKKCSMLLLILAFVCSAGGEEVNRAKQILKIVPQKIEQNLTQKNAIKSD